MVQDAVVLETRQHELRNIVNRRKRKLQELYQVTRATATAIARSHFDAGHTTKRSDSYTESDFLEANDLQKGRFFDIATLRRLPGADPLFDSNYSTTSTAVETEQPPSATIIPNGKPPTATKKPDSTLVATRTRLSELNPSNGLSAGSRPRSPVSPAGNAAEQAEQYLPSKAKTEAQVAANIEMPKQDGVASSHVVPVKHTTPVTPPADIPVVSNGASQDGDVASAAHVILKEQSTEPSASSPESQLLLEATQSGTQVQNDLNTRGQPGGPTILPNTKVVIPAARTNEYVTEPTSTPGILVNEVFRVSAQRPPMRIDTTLARPAASVVQNTAHAAATPSARQDSPPERMRTRVSSGAIRHKSVSEILGETPRTATHERTLSMDKSTYSPDESIASRRYSQVSGVPDTATFKRRLSELRDREKSRSQLSTVVFSRQQGQDDTQPRDLVAAKRGALAKLDRDYLLPLFLAQASNHHSQPAGLSQLIASSRKMLTTANHYLEFRELQDCRILKRIYTLQNTNKWSLRQPERAIEPDRPATQWDAILAESKWMRTDFREERKWKLAMAKTLAEWCADYVNADDNEQQRLLVNVKKSFTSKNAINGTTLASLPPTDHAGDTPTPELVASDDDDPSEDAEDDLHFALSETLPPAAVFSLGPEDILFRMRKTPVGDKLLSELPLYSPFSDLQKRAQNSNHYRMDASWRQLLTTVSRWNQTKIVFPDETMRKRRKISRYDYQADIETNEFPSELQPELTEVAMFQPANKAILQRLHQSHAFRIPAHFENPMPTQAFFEYRHPSQWTRAEDDDLRRLVREHAFNWSLISSRLQPRSAFTSSAERRTPWECFERWEGLEGMPTEYSRHDFYRRWQSRRHNAKAKHEEQFLAAQQHQLAAGSQMPLRRRNGEPQSAERKRTSKHVGMVQSMAKLAKKKEAQLSKQQHMASLAAQRKQTEPSQTNKRMQTPSEFSAHKHKQECEMRERHMRYRDQMQRAALIAQQQRSGMPGQTPNPQAIPQIGRGSAHVTGAVPHLPSSMQAAMPGGQARLMPPGQGMMNGITPNGVRPVAMPQAQMQAYRGNQAVGGDNARVLAEANRVSEQQRLMQQSRQYPPNLNGSTPHNMGNNVPQQNNASFANLQQQGGKLSPVVAGQRAVTSPRAPQVIPGAQLSSGHTPAINSISNHLKRMNPNWSDAQVSQVATQQLNMQLQNQRATANNSMHSAHGHGSAQQQGQQSQQGSSQVAKAHSMQASINGNSAFSGGMSSQAYAQAMRQQMQHQSSGAQGSVHTNGTIPQGTPRPESRGMTATPQNRTSTATPASAMVGGPVGVPSSGLTPSPRPQSAQIVSQS